MSRKGPGFLLEIVRYRRWWFTLSALLIVPGLISLLFFPFFIGLSPLQIKPNIKAGIDFTGGSLLEVKAPGVTGDQLKAALPAEYGQAVVQSTGDQTFQLRLKDLTPEQHNDALTKLKAVNPKITEQRFDTVGPTIGKDITRKAILSVIFGALLIILYIAYSFRNVPRPASSWRFGMVTIAALLHDIIFTLGFFSLLGRFAGIEIDATFVAAVLTVIGFSVHDTIVVFDRIRENLLRGQGSTLEDAVNFSIVQTLVRSINTSLTVLLVLAAMVFFGGASIHDFVLALLVGVAIGTYSSIFNAAPLLVTWQNFSDKRAKRAKSH